MVIIHTNIWCDYSTSEEWVILKQRKYTHENLVLSQMKYH